MGSQKSPNQSDLINASLFSPDMGGKLKVKLAKGMAQIIRVTDETNDPMCDLFCDDHDRLDATVKLLIGLSVVTETPKAVVVVKQPSVPPEPTQVPRLRTLAELLTSHVYGAKKVV